MDTIYEKFEELRGSLRHAFAIEEQEGRGRDLTHDELTLIRKLADAVVRRGMSTPAVLFLESFQPLNFIGSQAMYFLRPFMTFIFSATEYDKLARLLEKRSSIEILIREIQRAEEGAHGQR